MTVSSETKRADYTGNGSTVDFATQFRFLQNSDVKVILTVTATGVETDQVETTDYTLVGAGLAGGGTVTMLVAPPTGTTLTIKRDVPLTQGTDYVENDSFPAESHERALDKLTMITQQIQEELDRTLKLSETSQSTNVIVPDPVLDSLLRWDALGNLINVTVQQLGTVSVEGNDKRYGPIFPTVAAMMAANPVSIDGIIVDLVAGMMVHTQGFYEEQDRGGGPYVAESGDTSNGFDRLLAANGVTLVLQFLGAANVRQFGAKGDQDADDTAAIEAAHSSHGSIFIPNGIYRTPGLVLSRSGSEITGESMGGAVIEGTSTTGDVVHIGQTGVRTQKFYINNLSIRLDATAAGGDKAGGAHLYLEEVTDCEIKNVSIINWWNGLLISGGSNVTVNTTFLYNGGRSVAGNRALSVVYNSTAVTKDVPTSIYLNNVDIESRNTSGFVTCEEGFYFNSSDSIYMTMCHVFHARKGLHVEADVTAAFFIGLWVTNSYFDFAEDNNVLLTGASAVYEDILFTGCEFRAAEAAAIQFNNTATLKGVTFTGCHFRRAGTYSILCTPSGDVEQLVVNGCTFKLTNGSGSTGNIADAFYGSTVIGINHVNNFHTGGEPTAGKCVTISGDNIIVANNNFSLSDNLVDVQDNAGGAVHKVIANNT